jgi:hypothetical protein
MGIEPPISVFHHIFIGFLSAVPQEYLLPVHHTHQTHPVQASRTSKHKSMAVKR